MGSEPSGGLRGRDDSLRSLGSYPLLVVVVVRKALPAPAHLRAVSTAEPTAPVAVEAGRYRPAPCKRPVRAIRSFRRAGSVRRLRGCDSGQTQGARNRLQSHLIRWPRPSAARGHLPHVRGLPRTRPLRLRAMAERGTRRPAGERHSVSAGRVALQHPRARAFGSPPGPTGRPRRLDVRC